jgi:hypothetical protein
MGWEVDGRGREWMRRDRIICFKGKQWILTQEGRELRG